jgi:hypothetical protein
MASRRFSVRRKNRKFSRRRQRGGANLDTTTSSVATTTASSVPTTTGSTKTVVINCSLRPDSKVLVNSPPAGITINSAALTSSNLVFTSNNPIIDIKFSGPNGPVNPRSLGTVGGITIESASLKRVPRSFTSVVAMSALQRRLDSTSPISGQIFIRNLNTPNLGLSATNRNFTITLTTL